MLPRTIRKKCNYFGHVKSSIFLRSEEKFLRPIQAIFHQHEWSNVSLFNSSHLCIASTYTYSQLRFYENCWHIFGHTCPEIERSPALPTSTVFLEVYKISFMCCHLHDSLYILPLERCRVQISILIKLSTKLLRYRDRHRSSCNKRYRLELLSILALESPKLCTRLHCHFF